MEISLPTELAFSENILWKVKVSFEKNWKYTGGGLKNFC